MTILATKLRPLQIGPISIETPLVRMAQGLGIEVVTGLEMFVHQGARQWERWAGKQAPWAAMHEALQLALAREEPSTDKGVSDGKV